MLKPISILSMSAVLIALSLSADTVDNAEIVTFTAATPACAADVNQTIQELVSAINDNNAQIAALEARIAALEAPTLSAILTGSTFTVYTIETGVGATSGAGSAGILNAFVGGDTSIFTLSAGGILSVSYDFTERATTLDVEQNLFGDEDNIVTIQTDIQDSGTGTDTGTWSLSGSTLTISYDGDTDEYLVTPDGNMFVSGAAELDDEQLVAGGPFMTNADLVIGVRAVAAP